MKKIITLSLCFAFLATFFGTVSAQTSDNDLNAKHDYSVKMEAKIAAKSKAKAETVCKKLYATDSVKQKRCVVMQQRSIFSSSWSAFTRWFRAVTKTNTKRLEQQATNPYYRHPGKM